MFFEILTNEERQVNTLNKTILPLSLFYRNLNISILLHILENNNFKEEKKSSHLKSSQKKKKEANCMVFIDANFGLINFYNKKIIDKTFCLFSFKYIYR